MMLERLAKKHVVLLGVGHTNAHVLRMWGMHPIPDTDLTCVSDHSVATYSGMLPAALAGQITQAEMEIDLVRLCGAMNARLVCEPVVGLDLAIRQIEFRDRPSIPFDVLSIGIGSVPFTDGITTEEPLLVKIKPMQSFLERLRVSIEKQRTAGARSLRVAIVGSGVAGIEIAFCLPPFLKSLGIEQVELSMVTRSNEILPESNARARKLVLAKLHSRGLAIMTGKTVEQVLDRSLVLAGGERIATDMVIWATGACAPPLLDHLGLPQDSRGFIVTDASLKSISGQPIFAVGDSGSLAQQSVPKAGVHAVRQGPVLWDNIKRELQGRSLRKYDPQSTFLKLLNTGDGQAIGLWRGMSFSGHWVKRLKDSIDKTFIEKYQPRPMGGENPMQCSGCGSKLGAAVLQAAINASLEADSSSRPGQVAIEDAVEVGRDAGQAIVASTDFFSSPFDDAYLSGRIAALHSASDIIVSGAKVTKALANVVLPEGDSTAQQRTLGDFLAGARREFDAMHASIVGGHTIVGPRMEVGFTVIGQTYESRLLRKSNLNAGDQLFLIKPIGIGVLLAAHMRNQCHARNYADLLATMLCQQHEFAQLAIESGIEAATDVTGFGLAGHLLEMLAASEIAATIFLDEVAVLDGAIEAVQAGIESSLIDDNLQAERNVFSLANVRAMPKYRLLFDPQTCGGILFGGTEEQCQTLLQRIKDSSLPEPKWVGHCHARETEPLLHVKLQRDRK